jgi:uncharacterized membrane-anchored protein YhcB (DUF1043 family)
MATEKEDLEDADLLTRELQRFFETRITPSVTARTAEAVADLLAAHAEVANQSRQAVDDLRVQLSSQARSLEDARERDATVLKQLQTDLADLRKKINAAAEQEARDLRKVVKERRRTDVQDWGAQSPPPLDAFHHVAGETGAADVERADSHTDTGPGAKGLFDQLKTDNTLLKWGIASFVLVIVAALVLLGRGLLPATPAAPTDPDAEDGSPAAVSADPLADGWDDVAARATLARLCENEPCETFDGAWSAADADAKDRILIEAHVRLTGIRPECALVPPDETGGRARLDTGLREAGICLRTGRSWPLPDETGRREMATAMLAAAQGGD